MLRAFLQLVRLPAVFTAMADIFLGFCLTNESPASNWVLFGQLLVSSSCLYLSGMAFNDVFDRRVDAHQRPWRPIPSGRVSLRAAAGLASGLMVLGVLAAATADLSRSGNLSSPTSLIVAAALAGCILLYDGAVKSTAAGPVVMGCCRFLNVLLGASAVEATAALWNPPVLSVASALGIYIAGVTWFARHEAGRPRAGQLLAAAVVIDLGLAGVAWAAAGTEYGLGGKVATARLLAIIAVIAVLIHIRLFAAISRPAPATVQLAVRSMLLSLIMLDATLVLAATGEAGWAIVTAGLVVPALALSRLVHVT